ncbi:2-C-methyl-D-erythritol 4-phosphate cytidylyltransferase [Pedobacter puniceum]|uniref:2-C-methyl-D-erythritol 4-phosphate cytidylyltransferase n=1 Tax=Pedobacter puniceum TaxID=2666136 RepID=A0A7K0FRY6_9SPHI|nr:2-C-methyl-D-erythritol 4-phosphate cytidylyltransferase [Pedobacter puniceum]MRX48769.1 2-C-methyl-D-erythritol 4-phosphate cytidylyltransferase [Pedobacter puniceum]
MSKNQFYAIIVAGGSGKRMNSSTPKQFLLLKGKPILMLSIEKFYQSKYQPKIIVVLAEQEQQTWQELVKEYHFNIPHEVINGGIERFHSVKNALNKITDEQSIIAIHDAVRPLVSFKTIDTCFEKALSEGNAIAATPSKDSVRVQEGSKNKAIARNQVYLVQTPQVFQYQQLKKAYQQNFESFFTDDASVVERVGFAIHLCDGDEFNFKITFPEDIILAEAILNKQAHE